MWADSRQAGVAPGPSALPWGPARRPPRRRDGWPSADAPSSVACNVKNTDLIRLIPTRYSAVEKTGSVSSKREEEETSKTKWTGNRKYQKLSKYLPKKHMKMIQFISLDMGFIKCI